jgi:hypothetical protein
MFLLSARLNTNKIWIKQDLKNRERFYWQNVDAFGRHPSPPQGITSTPAALVNGVWYVAMMNPSGLDYERLGAERERFKEAVARLTGQKPSTLGFITYTPGWFDNSLVIKVNDAKNHVRINILNITLIFC